MGAHRGDLEGLLAWPGWEEQNPLTRQVLMAALSSTKPRELDVGVLHPSGGQSRLESGPRSRRSRRPLRSRSHGCKWMPKSVPHAVQGVTWLAV